MLIGPVVDRALDAFVEFMTGDPVRSILIGGVLVYAIGHWLGWWVVLVLFGYAVVDTVWCAGQVVGWWRRA